MAFAAWIMNNYCTEGYNSVQPVALGTLRQYLTTCHGSSVPITNARRVYTEQTTVLLVQHNRLRHLNAYRFVGDTTTNCRGLVAGTVIGFLSQRATKCH